MFMIEVELRAKFSLKIKENFFKLNPIVKKENILQIDKYFKVKKPIEWEDCVLRIRNNNNNEFFLAFKWKIASKNWDIAWPEWENKIENQENLEHILLTCWYENFVNIHKTRNSYKFEDFEINLDSIKWLWDFIEVELLVNNENEIENWRKKIIKFLDSIWIKENDLITKWYVPLCVEAWIR